MHLKAHICSHLTGTGHSVGVRYLTTSLSSPSDNINPQTENNSDTSSGAPYDSDFYNIYSRLKSIKRLGKLLTLSVYLTITVTATRTSFMIFAPHLVLIVTPKPCFCIFRYNFDPDITLLTKSFCLIVLNQ